MDGEQSRNQNRGRGNADGRDNAGNDAMTDGPTYKGIKQKDVKLVKPSTSDLLSAVLHRNVDMPDSPTYKSIKQKDVKLVKPSTSDLQSAVLHRNGDTAESPSYKSIKRKDVKMVKPIGQGGFGALFQAIWNDQDVAAKRLLELDRHEAEVLSDLDNPHIVKLLGVIEENFEFYLVLELCKGGSLRDYLNQHRQKKTKLSLEQILDYAKQAAKAIEYLKEKKIIHKDVKSTNYLIADGNLLKLADFGLAKNTDVTVTATERASYPWMAPELMKDGILSPSYDIHSYGVVVWELCTTEIPFADSKVSANLIWRICHNNERPPIPADCPKALADLMRWCWEPNWHKRPTIQNILEMLNGAPSFPGRSSPVIPFNQQTSSREQLIVRAWYQQQTH